jgi:restriction system protein
VAANVALGGRLAACLSRTYPHTQTCSGRRSLYCTVSAAPDRSTRSQRRSWIRQGFTEERQQVLHGDGPQTEIEYRLAWARSYLKGMGLLVNSKRGVWSLTEEGRTVRQDDIAPRHRRYLAWYREQRRRKRIPDEEASTEEKDTDQDSVWRDQLLDALTSMKPDGFERLAQRLLREAGFISATVTGRTGDGGIDGLGVYRMSLVSFPCSSSASGTRAASAQRPCVTSAVRWPGTETRDCSSTTGTFTSEAKAKATRNGAPPVDLIDGNRLCDLLKEYDLGVKITVRQVEDVSVDVTRARQFAWSRITWADSGRWSVACAPAVRESLLLPLREESSLSRGSVTGARDPSLRRGVVIDAPLPNRQVCAFEAMQRLAPPGDPVAN